MSSGGYTSLILGGSHPLIEDRIVTRNIYGTNTYYYWLYGQCGPYCNYYTSNPIQVKACPGHYYVYKLVKPDLSVPLPTYSTVAFNSHTSYDPCNDYTSLDQPWRANTAPGLGVCDVNFNWNGWYRLLYNGMDIRMAESCVDVSRCGTYYTLWLNGPHPQVEDGVVTRQVCANAGYDCCFYKSNPVRVKACPGKFYVYEIVRPMTCNMAYCTDARTITPIHVATNVSTQADLNTTTTTSPVSSTFDPCYNYNVLDNTWRNTYSYYGNGYYTFGLSGYYSSHDDTTIEWDGWYRLYLQGADAKISEWCVGSMSSGGYTPLILGGSHPLIEDGIVTREIYGSNTYYYGWYWEYYWGYEWYGSQCNYYMSNPIQVKACPGHYYVYKLVKPDVSIPLPTYTTVALGSPSHDPCNNYVSLDQPWRANTAPGLSICDVNFNWNGWYRLLYNGMDVRMAESCVDVNRCGSYYTLWLNGPHPQVEVGVVTRQVCGNAGSDCCLYKSNPIRVKACPGNFYVYEIVRPMTCNMAYCTDTSTITPNPVSAAISNSSELNTTTSPSPTGSTVDPCYNYNVLDDVWRTTYSYYGYGYYSYGFSNYFSSHDDTSVEWDGWYRLYLQGADAKISEWCVGPMSSGGYTPLILGGSHPLIEDGIVTREIYGSNTYYYWLSWGYYWWYWGYGWDNNQCSYYTSKPIQVKACPGHYYVYKLVKPDVSIPLPTYTTVAFNTQTSQDPCNDYTSLDQPWRANTAPGLEVCDVEFNWNGWYRLLYNGMDIRMAESCVDVYRCGSYYTLWLNGPHPQVEDGVVTRQVCANAGTDCCFYKSNPIRVKACPGNYYVYEIVRPMFCNMAYCSDINTTSAVLEPSNAESKEALPSSEDDVTIDPCHYYDVIDDYWRNEIELYSYYRGHDDTLVEWEGWYRLFLQGKSAHLSEWCVSYMTCGGYTALVLGGSHPRLEDGIVTREIYGYSNGQCNNHSRSNPIQVKACPGNYYIYKLVKPDISIPMPSYCAVSFTYPSNDPCYNYNVLDQPWRSINNAEHNNYYYYSWWWWWSWCDKYTGWNGWYRLHYDGNDIQMPDSCVNQGMCGTDIPLWLNGSRPQLEYGVVVQQVCGSGNGDCCFYKSFPIQVKACPGNYYVYELVSPVTCNSAYCIDVNTISPANNSEPRGTTEPTSVVTTPPTVFITGDITTTTAGTPAPMPTYTTGFTPSTMNGDITTIPTNMPFTTPAFTPVVTANATNVTVEFPRVDPCETYNELDEPWRATNNTNHYQVYFPWGQSPWCDTFTNWNGWYRLLYNGADVQMSDSCVTEGKCGTYIPLWLNGSHPQIQDGAVTRQVCASWNGSCCFHESSIQVKACPGGYYVYQFVAPTICFSAYCTDFGTSTPPTTPETPTTTPETNTTPETTITTTPETTAIIEPTTVSTTSVNANLDPSEKLSQPSATCSASGDPHYSSFDGHKFDFQGTCRYILATVCNDTQGLPYFHVSARNEPWNGLPVSITVDIYVIVSGYMVHMSRNMHGAVKVDNETRNLPVLLDSGRVSIYSSGMSTFIATDFGLSVSYDGSWVAQITVPGNYSGTTCGLCGNYNGQTSDDFLTSSGALETSASQFGASWRVENDTVCSDGCGDSCSSCPDQTRAQTQCEIIRDRQGPFSFCQAYVDPKAYFNDCVFDVCLSGYSNDVLCRSIQTYVSACHSANATVNPWRQNSTCRMDCPVNSHYELCGTDCGHTCASSTDAVCDRTCSEGCFCDEGFMRSGGLCVSVDQCGCLYDGLYFRLGEQFWTPECSQHCECTATNELSCVSTSCSPSEECAVRNGQRGCYSQMSSNQMPTTMSTNTINGQRSCSCQQKLHQGETERQMNVSAPKGREAQGMVYGVNNYQYDAHYPVNNYQYDAHYPVNNYQYDAHYKVNSYQYDAHYPVNSYQYDAHYPVNNYQYDAHYKVNSYQYDAHYPVNNYQYDAHYRVNSYQYDAHYRGTCRYTLATVCNDTQGLPYFQVSARNEPWNGLPVSITVDVYVIVSGYMVHMSRNMHGAVKVDNETRNLPVLLDSGRVSIYSSGMSTFIATDFGLSVSYDGSWVARITVPGNYSGTTCGLCGNYNGQKSDDFLTSSGALETSASQFGASWRIENDTVCSDGCGDSCSSCPDQTRAQTQCEIIRDRQGPFSFCQAYVDPKAYFHDCVFDVCLSGYSNDVLCRSIQTYVSACHSANATVNPWRQSTTCRMDCPVNSHYELCGTDCGHTCASSTDAVCERTCSEGCFCDEGFMRSGGLCVSVDQCGCLYDGLYFHLGEQFWTPECSQHCECSAPNELSCVSTSCSPSEECAVRNGQRGCYSQMSSTQMPTTTSTTTINALVDHCEEVNCTEDEWCGEMEGIHGCFCNQDDPRPNPETYDAVEVCDGSSGTMSLSRCQLFEAGFSVHTLHLSDPSCRGTVQNGRLVFHFDNDDHICGTNLTANGTHFIYENSIQMTFNSTESTINRQNMLQLQFSCVYALTQTLTMDPSFTPLQSTIYKNLPGVLGMYQVRMIPYQDPGFTLPYNGSAEVKVDQRVYVGVYVQGVDSRQIATMIDSCWATPVNDRNYGVRWDLISKQCPNPKDKTVRVLQSGVSTTARFSFEMFAFNNVAYNKVFIHCSIHLCLLQNKNCAALCHPGHHHRAARSVDIHDTSSISMGPFIRTGRKAGI
ncbi:uncharacterized protein LOC143516405 [Brachyhypopomus gauderio]|uniref:uncharacterized protein LOC143516405 n=1 Tax=Brachyhypopomus gauderio TaxID=698409 RepID=UPI00404326E4